ncbi:MAG: hypothetical protein QXL33_08035 [Sulfolobaceae archaeon]
MKGLEVIKSLIEQVLALGLEAELVVLDTSFYSAGLINYLSRFNFIIPVTVGKIGIHRSFDGEYTLK